MSLPNVNYHARLVPHMVQAGVFKDAPFTLIDVGCSLGLEGYWRLFADRLRAIGIDPMIEECERLQREETNPAVQYLAAWIKKPDFPTDVREKSDQAFARTSSWAATTMSSSEAPPAKVTHSDRTLTLDELVVEVGYDNVDFIKIDVDGGDLEVIASGLETINSRGVLGVEIECHFQGGLHEWANTFANVYRVLRSAGFSFFDLDFHRYSRASLPDRFEYPIPAGTQRGQPIWGNMLYMRDAAASDYEANWAPVSPASIVKLVCLFELYGLNDCATELILKHRDVFDKVYPAQQALDFLAVEWWPDATGYKGVIDRFRQDPTLFYPPNPYIRNENGTPTEEEKTVQSVFRQA